MGIETELDVMDVLRNGHPFGGAGLSGTCAGTAETRYYEKRRDGSTHEVSKEEWLDKHNWLDRLQTLLERGDKVQASALYRELSVVGGNALCSKLDKLVALYGDAEMRDFIREQAVPIPEREGKGTLVEERGRIMEAAESSLSGAEELSAFNAMNAAFEDLGANYWCSYATLCCDKIENGACPQTLNGVLEALGEQVSSGLPAIGLGEIEEMLGFLARCQSLGFLYNAGYGLIRLSRPELDAACFECLFMSQAMAFMSGWALQRVVLGVDDSIASTIGRCDRVLPLPDLRVA